MQPKKILLFIVGVLIALFAMTFFSRYHTTASGMVREGIVFGNNAMLRYPTPDILGMLFKNTEKENKRLDELIKKTEGSIVDEKTKTLTENDSLVKDSLHKLESNTEGKIYYPGNKIDYLKQLKAKLHQSSCQIVHYGDSQIEGDRITGYVRNRLQLAYEGGGPGFFPIKVVYNQNSIDINTTGNWVRYAFFDRKQRRTVKHDMYGLFATYSRFTPYSKDTASMPVSKASFTLKPSKKSYARLQNYTIFGLHYGNAHSKISIRVYEGSNLLRKDTLISDGKYHNYKISFATTPKELRVELEGRVSADFYGITLDAARGVRMDNVAMRGEAGRIFTRMNYENYRQMSVDRQPDFFIFQYGGNTIPYMKTDQQLKEYVEGLIYNMNWVKRANPKAMFMLLGPGDMTTSRNGKRLTYPFLPKLNELMKEEALKNGIAYFSMYEAMGGENAMITWVKEGMAASDYVHFSPKGTKLISEVFYQCLHNDLAAVE